MKFWTGMLHYLVKDSLKIGIVNQKTRENYRKIYRQFQRNRKKKWELEARWQNLCDRFLPYDEADSSWRFSRAFKADDPEQGWKLHISATILTACDVLEKNAPFLISRNILFKAPVSLEELEKINSGLTYDYTQVGKFLTLYPRSDEEAVALARRLHRLTFGTDAPEVPFDLQYRPNSCVYYRYGAFVKKTFDEPNGHSVKALSGPAGNLVPDDRENPIPEWVAHDPFQPRGLPTPANGSPNNPLDTNYRIFRALRQRGKGGVYQAIDLTSDPPRLCIIKEGRRHGEADWQGRDGFWRVKLEAEILSALQKTFGEAPHVYDVFEVDDSFFLVMEYVEGKSLDELMETRQRRFSVKDVLKYGVEVAALLRRIHAAGWMWRDCKPANIIVAPDGVLKPLDFESSSPIKEPNMAFWRTAAFSPPFNKEFFEFETGVAEDVYALGAMVYYLLTAKFYQPDSAVPVGRFRRNVPEKVDKMLGKLLSVDPRQRPSVAEAMQALNLSED